MPLTRPLRCAIPCLASLLACHTGPAPHVQSVPPSVDVTWFSISNVHFRVDTLDILADGYVTRIPGDVFSGETFSTTTRAARPDSVLVARTLAAFGGPSSVDVLITGHSHFDHAFDTGMWATLSGARVIGARTTCLQVEAQRVPAARCTAVNGGETIRLSPTVTMRVIRWNHSGSATTNPELHEPIELTAVPRVDPATGGLRAGVREDFPNGGGGRAYLFTVDAPGGRLSWFYQNSASPTDLAQPVVVDGVSYGPPLDNLKAAMRDAGLASVDLWVGTPSPQVAALVLPVLHPRAFLPIHFDDLAKPITDGLPAPFTNAAMEAALTSAGVRLVRPTQIFDRWRADATGVHPLENARMKQAFGLH
jgi:L-ascorbate metabolism protein UlaG (beta-lactamase superfamily)